MRAIIDGKELVARENQTILEAARENGIEIPSLCDHPHLTPFTGCRLCIVEIKGRKGFPPSCSTLVEEGMEVITNSRTLQNMRRQILELILSEHPNACLICTEKESCDEYKSTIRKVGEVTGCVLCSNNGRCRLQDVVESLGVERVHFPSVYRDFEVKKKDPFFDRNYNLCILCGRCVRICDQVRGASVISFVYRGSDAVVGTVLDKSLLDAGCQFCGACVDVCPTGALSERALKYELLPDKKARTICALCSMGCELEVWLRDGRILSTIPSPCGHNKGQACVKGRFGVRDVVYSPKRLLKPMIRKAKELEEVDWEEALSFVAAKLKNYEEGKVGFLSSPQVSCEDLFIFNRFAGEVLKTNNFVPGTERSPLSEYLGGMKRYGVKPLLNFQIEDVTRAKKIILTGADLTVTHPIVWMAVMKAVRNGAHLIVAGPVGPGIERHAASVLRIGPGSEVFFYRALAGFLLDEKSAEDFKDTEGFGAYQKVLKKQAVQGMAEAMGVPETDLEKAGNLLKMDGPAVILSGGISGSDPDGEGALPDLWNFSLLARAPIIPLADENNLRGALEFDRFSSRENTGYSRLIEGIEQGKIKALFCVGGIPDLPRKKVEFLVIQDSFLGDSSETADVLLPSTTFAEADGTFVNAEGRVQKFDRVIEPLGDSRPDWKIVSEIAQRLGHKKFEYKKAADIFKVLAGTIPGFQKISWAGLSKDKAQFVNEKEEISKKFFSTGQAALPQKNKKYPFWLYLTADLDVYKSCRLSRELKGLGKIRNSSRLKMSPRDAADMSLEDGESVEIQTPSGSMEALIRISDSMPEGMVSASRETRFRGLLPAKIKKGK